MKVEALEFVVVVLAAYRITRFLVKDSLIGFGPDSASRISVRLDRFAYDSEGNGRSWWREYVGDLLTCTWCLGFWVSLAVACTWLRLMPWELGIEGWGVAWGVAGAQGYLNTRMNA